MGIGGALIWTGAPNGPGAGEIAGAVDWLITDDCTPVLIESLGDRITDSISGGIVSGGVEGVS